MKGSKLVDSLFEIVRRDISPQDKMRLLMTFIISQEGIRDDDRRRLMDAAGLSQEDQAAIVNLFYLGVNLSRGTSKGAPKRKPGPKSQVDDRYTFTRYTPVLKIVAEEVLTQAPAAAGYPYVKDKPAAGISTAEIALAPAARAGDHPTPSWASRGRTKKEETTAAGPRLVIFVIGGATYSELKCGYELSKVRALARARRLRENKRTHARMARAWTMPRLIALYALHACAPLAVSPRRPTSAKS